MKLVKIHIERFRGIEDQTISDINNALAFIGKNNAGKSAALTAIRALWGNYTIAEKDFHKNSTDLKISATFICEDDYLLDYFTDSKIGIMKVPSSSGDYNNAREGTKWEEISFNDFKTVRTDVQNNGLLYDISTKEDYLQIWLKAIKSKFNITEEKLSLELTYDKASLKPSYDKKEAVCLLPALAFINESRNFEEEESGKNRSLTANMFNHILNMDSMGISSSGLCENCNHTDCETRCITAINEKTAAVLTMDELQKLVNFRAKSSSASITRSISERFNKNYRKDFKVNIKATSSINKSFSISTKIYDPALDSEIELSNVGAGVRSVYILSLLQVFQEISAKHTIFIIEEPELYLHPQLQKKMAKTLSEISENNQVFFATHSPLMLREFSSHEIRQVKLDEDKYVTLIETADLDDILNEIGYSSQDVLNTDYVIFVEGESDKEILECLLPKYYNIELERISIIDTKSCSNIGYYATLRFLNKTKMSKDLAIIRDVDTETIEAITNTLKNQLSVNMNNEYFDKISDKIYITKFSSIEGYFFSPEVLVNHNIYETIDDVYNDLCNKLTEKKSGIIKYFKKHNSGNEERIKKFEEEYDDKVAHIRDNLEWMKCNVQGHTYFGFTHSGTIPWSDYVNELSSDTFKELLDFFDSISYFFTKKI